MARSLESTFWETDHVGRWSDDQFLIILNGCREESLVFGPRSHPPHARAMVSNGGERRRSLPVPSAKPLPSPVTRSRSLIERSQKSLEAPAGTRALPLRAEEFQELGMFAIIGIVVVFGCVLAGYLMEHGNLKVLIQPAELVIIGGAALGTLLVANPFTFSRRSAVESAASLVAPNSARRPTSTP